MKRQTWLQGFFAKHPELVQTALAEQVGISQSHLSLIASGRRQPSVPVAKRLLKVVRRYEPDVTFERLLEAA